MFKQVSEGSLPATLAHPLRRVHIRRYDGSQFLANVTIAVLTKNIPIPDDECLFYALVSPLEVRV